jgi:membrane protease YdiL (CAAX protease family)
MVATGNDVGEILSTAFLIGIFFTSIAYLFSAKSKPLFEDKQAQKNESLLLISILVYFTLYITFYRDILTLTHILGAEETPFNETVIGIAKLLFVVIVPMLIYHSVYGFKLKDWGIQLGFKLYFSRQNLLIFFTFTLIILLFQYFFGNGAKPLREGLFSGRQIVPALVLSYFWLIITVGIVEEFFFRVLLQSRISVILKSELGGIILSAMLFGLAHAPGIFLRGGGVIANLGDNPGFLLSLAYSFLVLSAAGFFLSVIWLKTKNFWLIVAIHASVDLLPNLGSFIELWEIK